MSLIQSVFVELSVKKKYELSVKKNVVLNFL